MAFLYLQTFLSLSVLALFVNARSSNYCSKSLCEYRHIACRNHGRFSNECPPNAHLVDLRWHIQKILDLHNEKRNEIAGGGLTIYRPAARMATMQWDEELAYLATFNVKQCTMRHDCHNTKTFIFSGQNLGHKYYSGLSYTDDDIIQSLINAWFAEYKDANMRIIDNYPAVHRGPKIGHFTAMVTDRNIRVGCAAARYQTGRLEHFLFACNYASTNLIGEPVYKSSSSPASECQSGRNAIYRNLCSPNEFYNELYSYYRF